MLAAAFVLTSDGTLRSIGAILLIAADYREMWIVGLLYPDAANPFNPQWLPMIPFVKFAGVFSHTNIANGYSLTKGAGERPSHTGTFGSW
jgi:hypothetical protein